MCPVSLPYASPCWTQVCCPLLPRNSQPMLWSDVEFVFLRDSLLQGPAPTDLHLHGLFCVSPKAGHVCACQLFPCQVSPMLCPLILSLGIQQMNLCRINLIANLAKAIANPIEFELWPLSESKYLGPGAYIVNNHYWSFGRSLSSMAIPIQGSCRRLPLAAVPRWDFLALWCRVRGEVFFG